MILYCLIIILFLIVFVNSEHFNYFNLNFNKNDPISYNNEQIPYKKVNFDKINYKLPKNIQTNIFNNRIKFKNIANYEYNNDIITTNLLDSSNCCLVQKEFNDGKFSYKYTPLKNDQCNINIYELDNNNKLLFDNINDWNNNYCVNNSKILGSCRKANMECIDLITELECNYVTTESKANFFLKFDRENKNNVKSTKTVWSDKTCQERIF